MTARSLGQCDQSIIGTCQHMCPTKERLLREKEGLLHRFECSTASSFDQGEEQMARTQRALELAQQASGPSAYGGSYQIPINNERGRSSRSSWHREGKAKPKADIHKTVKSFARSAAGQDKTLPEDLRPPKILEETVAYLYKEILVKQEPYVVIYDFVFDRLRSVRQDLVIQRISDRPAIKILESIVRFHVYSGFILRNEPPSVYDSHINDKHLRDCLRTLLVLYEANEYMEPSRTEFEALNVLLSPESIPVLTRALSLNSRIRSNEEFQSTVKMSLAYQFKNYVAYFRLGKRLRPVLASCIAQYVRQIRSNAYRAMSLAYGMKTCKIPLPYIASVLDYPNTRSLEIDLACCSVNLFTEDSSGSGERFARFDKNCANIPIVQVQNLMCEFGDINSGCNSMSPNVCQYSYD